MITNILIIGTGLSSYGACLALIDSEQVRLHVMDIGLVEAYVGQDDFALPNSKSYAGSFFIYGLNDKRWPFHVTSRRICSSHAKGGFAKVYSGSILAPQLADLAAWPQFSRPTEKHYQAIIEALCLSYKQDELQHYFPLIPSYSGPLSESNLKSKKSILGYPRIAYQSSTSEIPFDPSSEFEKWADQGKINYIKSSFVYKLSSIDQFVDVFYKTEAGNLHQRFDCVLLGAGCINSTAIIHNSLYQGRYESYELKVAPISLQLHVKLFPSKFFPLSKKCKNQSDNPDLCRAFFEHKLSNNPPYWCHTQFNYLNSSIFDSLRKFLPYWLVKIIFAINKIFVFSITVFHSDLGPSSKVICSSDSASSTNPSESLSIHVEEPSFESTRSVLNSLNNGILSKFLSVFLIPLPFSNRLADFIRKNKLGGWHYGGTLAMSSRPTAPHLCSPSGEVSGLPNVYVVDASSFPTVPGSSVALLTMANSYRISHQLLAQLQE
jgi:hypothetical protein